MFCKEGFVLKIDVIEIVFFILVFKFFFYLFGFNGGLFMIKNERVGVEGVMEMIVCRIDVIKLVLFFGFEVIFNFD